MDNVIRHGNLHAVGEILGSTTVTDSTGDGLGMRLTGVFHDRTGNYGLGFTVCATLIERSFLASIPFRNERKTRLDLAAQGA